MLIQYATEQQYSSIIENTRNDVTVVSVIGVVSMQCVRVHVSICLSVLPPLCLSVHAYYACMHVCIHACVHTCVYACVHVCVCVCMCMRVHVFVHWIIMLQVLNYSQCMLHHVFYLNSFSVWCCTSGNITSVAICILPESLLYAFECI